ncbi:DUF397 domain-containing protein [Streptomyces sp. NPDC051286]|uniref:DUF397 domain-containing protein n=1 Tax=Streptomyces sp. NPDC051286 TaxID=3365647 RepID=UPI0037AA3312
MAWFKSSYSTGNGGECVQIAVAAMHVHIRDSKQVGGPMLTVRPEAWAGLLGFATGREAR